MNVFETSASGNLHAVKDDFQKTEQHSAVTIDTKKRKQTIIGFGGAFTEATAHNINLLSPENRAAIIEAYFGDDVIIEHNMDVIKQARAYNTTHV